MFHKLDQETLDKFELDMDKLIMNSYAKELYIHVSIIIKKYIYYCKVLKITMSRTALWNIILWHRDVEQKIAIANGKLEKFNDKWSLLLE